MSFVKRKNRDAEHKLGLVYAGDCPKANLRLVVNEGMEIHLFMPKPVAIHPIEFAIPKEATRGGELTLNWTQESGKSAGGRGCQVAEVRLMRK